MKLINSAGAEPPGLAGVRVLEFFDPKTALCGKLLADLGADVVLVEPPGGAPGRQLPPFALQTGASLFFCYFNTGKRSLCLDLGTEAGRDWLLALVASADVLLESFPPGYLASTGLDDRALFLKNPGLVLASLTAFGQTGPYRSFQASDIVAWAMGGVMGLTGDQAREPLTAPALQAFQIASLWMTIAVQAALYRRLKAGRGARLDLSVQEAVFDISETAHSFYLSHGEVVKRNSGDNPLACPFRVYRSADGYAFIGLSTQQQWRTLVEWMRSGGGLPGSLSGPHLAVLHERLARRALVNQGVGEWSLRLTNHELFIGGAERGIPNAPIRSVPEVVGDEQLQARRFFLEIGGPEFGPARHPYPSLPFRGRGAPPPQKAGPPPRPGQHADEVLAEWAAGPPALPPASAGPAALPLEGVQAVEICWNVAGPTAGRILADLGAEVIKVEPREIGDPGRMLPPFPAGTPHLGQSLTFHDLNRNKKSICINLKHPEGKRLLLRLLRRADILLENFTAGTLDRLGIGFDVLSQAAPRLVLGSISGYGQTGPRRTWPSYHPTSAGLSGLTGLVAYPGGPPIGLGHSHMDYVAGLVAAIGVLDALLRRQRTGSGDHVDVSQLECGVMLMGLHILDWSVNGVAPRSQGNWSGALGAFLQGCYRCRGEDEWIVVTAPDEAAASRLSKLLGRDASGGAAPTLAALDEALRVWARGRDAWSAAYDLQRTGVPAGPVSHGPDLIERDEHLRARGAIARLPHQEMGAVPIAQCPIVLDGVRLPVRTAAPLLGQHAEYLCRNLLGMTEQEYLGYILNEVI